jgi:SpoIIAA-like
MPVIYQIDRANGIIRTRCVGPVTIDEVIDHFRQLERDADCPERLDVLLDISEETSVPESEDLREVTREIRRIRNRVQFDRCAIVASRDVLVGMMRMFAVFTEEYFRETRVFRDAGYAEAWLVSQQRSASASAH